MSPHRIVSAECALCGKRACGEKETCVAAGWTFKAGGTMCPECARREKCAKKRL